MARPNGNSVRQHDCQVKLNRRTVRSNGALRRAGLAAAVIAVGAILVSCSFGRERVTPTPFEAQSYQPGVSLPTVTPEAASGAAGSETSGSAAAPATGSAAAAGAPPRLDYSAEILAREVVPIGAEVNGQALKVNVDVGDVVKAGDALLQIDSTTLEAQRAQALAGLEATQAQLDLLLADIEEADLEAARAGVAAAQAAYQRALDGPTEQDLIMAESQLRQAEAAVRRAQAAYDQVAWSPLIAALPESLMLEQATLAFEAAQAQFDKLVEGATEDVIAGAYAQVANARAQLERLEQGPKAALIRAAEAQVRQAETVLYLAQLQLAKTTLRAPIDGVVSQVNTSAGAMVSPGAPVFIVLSDEVDVVVPVEESRIASLRVGQPALIRVDAYPDRTFEGEVAIVAPELDAATRTVRVIVRPKDDAGELAPGMFAAVELLN